MKKLIFLLIFFSLPVHAEKNSVVEPIRIYQDADISNHRESASAIQLGIKVAFDEIDNQINGYPIEYKFLDHRGNVTRSKRNYKSFLADPRAIVMYSGMHSPPLIKNRDFINKNQALTLVPWAAAGPITRHSTVENWIFRLSIDDTRASDTLVDYALNKKQCKSPYLLLESTSWGDSNLKSLSRSLQKRAIPINGVSRIHYDIKELNTRFLLRKIVKEADCLILVANSIEGVVVAKAMLALPKENRIPIISHWGITGGDFQVQVPAKEREQIDLSFIQSCFAFTNQDQSEFSAQVFARLKKISQSSEHPVKDVENLKSAVGFIHAYDLSRLLIQAIQQVGISNNLAHDRNAIRQALENLQQPVTGLIKTYSHPFSSYHPNQNINAHEALNSNDFCMGYYGQNDEILILQKNEKNLTRAE